MMRTLRLARCGLFLTVLWISTFATAQESQQSGFQALQSAHTIPGPTKDGFLLPNGWHISPAGRQIAMNDLVLNIRGLSDGKHAIATCDGFNEHYLAVFDLESGEMVSKQTAYQSWFGLAVDERTNQLWWSGGGAGYVHHFSLTNHQLNRLSASEPNVLAMSEDELRVLRDQLKIENAFRSGLAYDEKQKVLYSLLINSGKLVATAAESAKSDKHIGREATLGGRPYDVQVDRDGRMLYISDWAGERILFVEADSLRIVATVRVGEHPTQIALHPTDSRLFVTCASSNCVSVIDTRKGIVIETIFTSLFPLAPEGSTPTALAIAPDGKTLYVANSDNNCVAVVDIAESRKSSVKGFIPTGWYPTAVSVTPDGKKILIGVGKGNQTKANPIPKDEPNLAELTETEKVILKIQPFPYIGTTLNGALSIVDVPEEQVLREYTQQVYANCPYSDSQLSATKPTAPNPIPQKVGDASPIKYVIYVIKENRTYDQVFGDLAAGDNPQGNGDPSLCMFPRSVTPNHHKLAEEYVLLDNIYCNGQVSRDGHPWSTMAYNTDYTARDWHLTYSRRAGVEDDEDSNLASSPSGYIWDACMRANVTYRSYKEYGTKITDDAGNTKMEGRVPGLVGHMCPNFGIGKAGQRERDMDLVEIMLDEYKEFAAEGTMPKFIVMSLGEDHTDGTRPGAFTPQACVASNDLALGKLVEAVSHGPLWNQTAIFVIEDDAQNGPDHVDAHRTVSLVISPYTKRKFVDSTQYSTVSMIRTMELILGLEPLSQYDAAATPMFNSFTLEANFEPYQCEPAQIDLQAQNQATAYGAKRSLEMDFSEYDRIDDFELNEILWKAIMGEDAPVPPAVRRAIAFRSVGQTEGASSSSKN